MPIYEDKDRLRSVHVGQEVITRMDDQTTGIRCVVTSVSGPSVCVENKRRNFFKWLIVTDLYPYDDRAKSYAAILKNLRRIKAKNQNCSKNVETSNISSDFADMVDSMLYTQA